MAFDSHISMFQVALDAARAAFFSSSAAYQLFWIVLSAHAKFVFTACRVPRPATVCELISADVSELVFRNTMDRGNLHSPLHAFACPAWAACWQSSTGLAAGLWHSFHTAPFASQPPEGIGLEGERAGRGKGGTKMGSWGDTADAASSPM